jgi:hypothetical protein
MLITLDRLVLSCVDLMRAATSLPLSRCNRISRNDVSYKISTRVVSTYITKINEKVKLNAHMFATLIVNRCSVLRTSVTSPPCAMLYPIKVYYECINHVFSTRVHR